MEIWLYAIILLGVLVVFGLTKSSIESMRTLIEVPLYFQAIASVKGQAPTLLGTGRHVFWTKDVQHVLVDTRSEWIQVSGQELLTKDGAPVRISVAVFREVSDVMKYAAAGDTFSRLYVGIQLAVRDQVLVRTLDELLEDREAVAQAVMASLEGEAEAIGVTIARTAIRDLTLIGDTKRAFAEVIQAQLRAKAKLEQARGEAAAMRSLLNTAELVRKNPELLQLRTLQQLESGTHQVHLTLGAPTPAKETE